MKKLLTLLTVLLLSHLSNAQTSEKKFVIYFATDSDVLDETSRLRLDSIENLVKNVGHYSIFLYAHTDEAGSIPYNEALSKKREVATSNYLQQKGIRANSMTSSSFGEKRPVLKEEGVESIQENRRVEILLRYKNFQSGKEILETGRADDKQIIRLTDAGAQEIQGEKGIQLLIPANAFMKASGDFVSNESVQIELEEFPGFGEAVQHGLGTLSNGRLLESGGMFYIGATAGGETLRLREGMEIAVQLPSQNIQSGMTVFYGERNEQGVVDWTNSGQAFKATDTSTVVKLPLPGFADELLGMRKPLPEVNDYTPEACMLKIPKRPNMPHLPRKPSPPVEPQRPEHIKEGLFAIFNEEWREWYKDHTAYLEDIKRYNKRMEQYAHRIEIYHKQMEDYRSDSLVYARERETFNESLNKAIVEREELFESLSAWLEVAHWNNGLQRISRLMRDSVYYSSHLSNDIRTQALLMPSHTYSDKTKRLRQEIDALTYLKKCDEKEALNISDRNRVFQFQTFYYKNRNGRLLGSTFIPKVNRCYVKDGSVPNPALERLEAMEAVIAGKKSELGIFNRSDLPSLYTTRINNMGYINCDRFNTTPQRLMAVVRVKGVQRGDQVFVCVHRLKSVLPLYAGENGIAVTELPIGEKVTLVSIGAKDGRAVMDIRKFSVGREISTLELAPEIVHLDQIKSTLASL
ncbi:MAG TPA: hypothetical protein DIW47_12555 [Bacteroidetes bacterium]|nr:hypothetical protein [Bacteroidota bacterium]